MKHNKLEYHGVQDDRPNIHQELTIILEHDQEQILESNNDLLLLLCRVS